LASCDLVLFFEESTLLGELSPGEHGRPDGAYAGGDAAYRYDQRQDRVQRGVPPPHHSRRNSMGLSTSVVKKPYTPECVEG
jgi:hypothetical protein